MILQFLERESFHLITFRAVVAAILAFLFCLLLGPHLIAWLRTKKIGEQTQKKDSERLDLLHAHKVGTPTMGGALIVMAILLSILVCGNFKSDATLVLVFTTLALALVGASDDYLKLTGKSHKGMPLWEKLLLQVFIGLVAGYALQTVLEEKDNKMICAECSQQQKDVPPKQIVERHEVATTVFFPIAGGVHLNLGWLYPLFVMFVIVSCTNAVNITDGLDGLASGCLVIAFLAYAVIAYLVGRVDFTKYLEIPYVRASAEVTVFATAALGACIAFLWFNCHPAQIFMGDSGSLPLGGALGLVACITKQELLLFLVGGIFVVEVLSSLLQIVAIRFFGKRIFLIAPLHHHFQFKGIPESKITLRFWIVAAILALASLATLKLKIE